MLDGFSEFRVPRSNHELLRPREFDVFLGRIYQAISEYIRHKNEKGEEGWQLVVQEFYKKKLKTLQEQNNHSLKELKTLVTQFCDEELRVAIDKNIKRLSSSYVADTVGQTCQYITGFGGGSKELKPALEAIAAEINPYKYEYIEDEIKYNFKKKYPEKLYSVRDGSVASTIATEPLIYISLESQKILFEIAYSTDKLSVFNIEAKEKDQSPNNIITNSLIRSIKLTYKDPNCPPLSVAVVSREKALAQYLNELEDIIVNYGKQENPTWAEDANTFYKTKILPLNNQSELVLIRFKEELNGFIKDLESKESKWGNWLQTIFPTSISEGCGATHKRLKSALIKLNNKVNPYSAGFVYYELANARELKYPLDQTQFEKFLTYDSKMVLYLISLEPDKLKFFIEEMKSLDPCNYITKQLLNASQSFYPKGSPPKPIIHSTIAQASNSNRQTNLGRTGRLPNFPSPKWN